MCVCECMCVCLGSNLLNCLFSTLKLSCCCCVHSFVHFFQLLLLSLVAVAHMLRRRLSLSLSPSKFVCIPSSSFAVFFFFGICKLHKLSWTINYGKIIMDCCFGVCVCVCACLYVCLNACSFCCCCFCWLGLVRFWF